MSERPLFGPKKTKIVSPGEAAVRAVKDELFAHKKTKIAPRPDQLDNFLSAVELSKRWEPATEGQIAELIRFRSLNAYRKHNIVVSEDGNKKLLCERVMKLWERNFDTHSDLYLFGGNIYLWDGIYFDMKDVEAVESQIPEYTYKVVCDDFCGNDSLPSDLDGFDSYEWISANDVRKEMKLSPVDFCDFLDSGELQTNKESGRRDHFNASCYAGGYFVERELPSLRIFAESYRKYCENHGEQPSLLATGVSHDSSQRHVALGGCDECEQYKARIAELEAELAERKKGDGRSISAEHLGGIVQGVAAVVRAWDGQSANAPCKKHGCTEDELEAWGLASAGLTREVRRAIKKVLSSAGMQVWLKKGVRPSS